MEQLIDLLAEYTFIDAYVLSIKVCWFAFFVGIPRAHKLFSEKKLKVGMQRVDSFGVFMLGEIIMVFIPFINLYNSGKLLDLAFQAKPKTS